MNAPARRYSEQEVAELKANADLVSIVRSKVELKREGPEWKGLCPFHAEKSPSFCVIPSKQIFYCFGCKEHGDVFKWLHKVEGLDFHAAIARLRGAPAPVGRHFTSASGAAVQIRSDGDDVRAKIAKARKIWDEAVPAHGTLVERYLTSRGLDGIMIPPTLRFHPQLWNQETGKLMPGMVAVVTDIKYQIVGIHRTYLRPDGRGKAELQNAKKMLGPCKGGYVRLGLPNCGKLATAEGIETSLSVMKAKPDLSAWAALTLGNMDAPIPNSVDELIMCADGDNKDPQAADKILYDAVRKHRKASPGLIVRIARPPPGTDFNDVIRGSPRAPGPDIPRGFLPGLQEPSR